MIEIVYNKENQNEENIFSTMELPKNIRQIGISKGNRRIYIEDYVMTYLKQLANPNSSYARGAILVGECVKNEYGSVVFISGALAAQNLELDLDRTSFDGEIWSYIYQEVKHYFPELEVVGWFLSRMGFSVELNETIVQLHMDNFAGNEKVLFVMDSLEGEEAFYMMENGILQRQGGYFIYYARNEEMQNFMIESKESEESSCENEVEKKDEAVIKNYRKIMEERARSARIERMNGRLSFVCSLLVISVLGLGVAVLSNYRMIEKIQMQIVEANQNNEQDEFAFKLNNEKEYEESNTLPRYSEMGNEKKDDNRTEKEEGRITVSATNFPRYYVVEHGDTLSSISFKMYNSVNHVSELMEANELGEADDIREGDRILIPSLQR